MREYFTFVAWLRLFFFVKVITLKMVFNRLGMAILITDSLKHWLQLLRLIASMVIIAHAIACLFVGVAKYETLYHNYTNVWIFADGLLDTTLFEQYLQGFYWACCLMINA